MKQARKRTLSALLALCLCLCMVTSLFPAMAVEAVVSGVGTEQGENPLAAQPEGSEDVSSSEPDALPTDAEVDTLAGETTVTTIENDNEVVGSDTGKPGPWKWYGLTSLTYLAKAPGTEPATVTVTFTGTKIVMVGQKATNGPIMTATIDGVAVDAADFFNNPSTGSDVEIWTADGLQDKEHKLVLTFGDEFHKDSVLLQGARQPAISKFVVTRAGEETSVPSNDASIAYDSGVSEPWPAVDGHSQTDLVGATMTVPFTGSAIAIQGKKLPTGYKLSAVIDEAAPEIFDTYAVEASAAAVELYKKEGLADGDHTLVLTVTDQKNDAATTEGIKACIDNFKVTAPAEEVPPEVPEGTVVTKIENTAVRTHTGERTSWDWYAPMKFFAKVPGASPATATVTFTGTKIVMYGQKAYNGPIMTATIDGVTVDAADFFNNPSTGSDVEIWTADGLQDKEHKLVLTFGDEFHKDSAVSTLKQRQAAITRFVVTSGSGTTTLASAELEKSDEIAYDTGAAKPWTIAGKYSQTTRAGATVTVPFRGNSIAVYGQKLPSGHKVSASIDGGTAETIDTYAVATGNTERLWEKTGLESGSHTLVLTVTEDKNTSATATGVKASIDYFSVTEVGKSVTGTVKETATQAPIADVAVTVGDTTVYTNASGVYTFDGASSILSGTHTATFFKEGYRSATTGFTLGDGSITVQEVTMTAIPVTTATISTADMDVLVDEAFPRVISYTMKEGANADKVLHGQGDVLDTLVINGTAMKPVVTSKVSVSNDKITYTMTVENATPRIGAVITADLTVEDNTLAFNITDVAYTGDLTRATNPVESIFIPNHSLISVRSTETDAELAAARLGSSTIKSGDSFYAVDSILNVGALNGQSHMYAFLSNDDLSAGISSNSDIGAGAAAGNNYRITLSAVNKGPYKTVGAGSSLWYYDRKISSSDPHEAGNITSLDADEMVVGIRDGLDEKPYVKVVVTGDENGDSAINWQDGAIAARETEIIHIPAHSDSVPDLVTTRIAMNFQSQATNPFLTSLDNVKRAALHSDGLGQSILHKGYANEGHDSGHPDYGDIGRRMGGAEDMLTMLVEGQKYGAEFGIHVNASEFYPEAKAFNEDMVSREAKGANGEPGALDYRWNWLDQGIGMNGVYDLASGNRNDRWDDLYKQVADKLDYVYVDVWGNNTSGSEDAWQTRKLSNEITGHDWRIVHEWGYANEWDSTFQHWVSDYGYGGYDQKGQLNSEIMRFMLNSHKDSFVPDFPTYGGAANAPLLGGPVMQGFESWQSDMEYDLFVDNLYNQMLPTKFLQHYDIMQWIDNDDAVSIPYAEGAGTAQPLTSNWTPEVQIKLQSDDHDTVLVTRGKDGEIDEKYSYKTPEEQNNYRSRHITLNGKVILTGAAIPGEFIERGVESDMTYLIPWFWDTEGAKVSANKEKLYHYNIKGGTTTWELPDGWKDLANVKVYTLTDQGRADEQTATVTAGKITLTAKAKTPYIVVKGENGAAAPVVVWTAPGTHLTDVGFNGVLADSWTVTGAAERVTTIHNIPMLKMTGEASVSQTMTDLKPGQKYAIYVGVDNRSDAKATMTVKNADGTVLATNYTEKSILLNYVASDIHHNGHNAEAGSSYFQNMYIFFTAPETGDLTFTLSRAAGEGNTYFDDVRVVKNESNHYTFGAEGKITSFAQDFENVGQGVFPFVISNAQGMADGRTHLSEKNAPYTQAGWDVKKMDDVLGGDWSVKINGLTQLNGIVYQTIPQNFRFEPNKTYLVSFDYQMGSNGTYELVYGSGSPLDGSWNTSALEKTLVANPNPAVSTTKTYSFILVGAESGQSWFGIRSTRVAPDSMGTTGAATNFGGYSDFILDNVKIELSTVEKADLFKAVSVADGMAEVDYKGDWAAFKAAHTAAHAVMIDRNSTQEQVNMAMETLETAIEGLTRVYANISGTLLDGEGNPIVGAAVTLEDNYYVAFEGKTATTDEQGKYSFKELAIRGYQVKIVAAGYDVMTVAVPKTVGDEITNVSPLLTAQTVADYTNTFDDGDISTIKPLKDNVGGGKNEVIEAVTHNESAAVKITFNVANRNHVVDEGIKMKNGTVEMDVTTPESIMRFGMLFRAVDASNFNYVGPYDNDKWNCFNFNKGVEDYGTIMNLSGPAPMKNVTRNIKLTMDGDKITLLVDGVMVINNRTMGNPFDGEGYVGIYSMANAGTHFIVDNIRVTHAYSISGVVKGEDSKVEAGATVTVKKGETTVAATVTDDKGAYTTPSLPADTYTVVISAEGYTAKTLTVTTTNADATDKDATLAVDAVALTTQLQELYDDNKTKTQGSYTTETWTAFQTALKKAEALLKKGITKKAEADAVYAALVTAIESLVENAPLPSGGGSNTTTKTETNADGSKTTTVTDKKTGTVTETTKYPDGKTEKVITKKDGAVDKTVTEPDGKEIKSVTTAAGDKTVAVTDKDGGKVAEISIPAVIPAPEQPFADVAENSWAKSAVDMVTGLGLFTGTGGNSFSGELPMSRGMLTTVLHRFSGEIPGGEHTFGDVADGAWYASSAAWAVKAGIVTGTGNGTFAPEENLTRESLAVMLHRYANLLGMDTTVDATALSGHADKDSVSSWAGDAMAWAVKSGIINGKGGALAPADSVTRAEVAVMLERFIKLL